MFSDLIVNLVELKAHITQNIQNVTSDTFRSVVKLVFQHQLWPKMVESIWNMSCASVAMIERPFLLLLRMRFLAQGQLNVEFIMCFLSSFCPKDD